ncbi:MAG: ligase-associated DNA damage response endonuclease PdeM [Hyphomicrobiaceae bacterium]
MGTGIAEIAALETSFETRTMQVGETEIVADRTGALYVPCEGTLIVADLHLEKGSSYAARGIFLPPYDTLDTLQRLDKVIRRFRPRRVIALGDSFHDRRAADRLGTEALAILRRQQRGREWVWITGNHDPDIRPAIGGHVHDHIALGRLVLHHEPVPGPVDGEIAGHLHPAARVAIGGAGLRRPCFVASQTRLVLPAFGSFTGGLNVLDPAFEPLFDGDNFDVHVLGQAGVYPIARSSLTVD